MVHSGGIGDFILTCPVIRELSKSDSVTLAGYPDRLALAVHSGIAEQAVSLDTIDFHSLFGTPSGRLISFLKPFDRVIVWMRDEDRFIGTSLARITDAQIDVFPGLPPNDWTDHASRYFESCLNFSALPPVRLSIEAGAMVHDGVIHSGSGSPDKNWPRERFYLLADMLQESGRSVAWCLGPAESEQSGLRERDTIIHSETLVELAGQLATAQLYIGNDSGITHLSAALGVKTVVVFGATNPAVWAPMGEHVRVMQGNPWPTVEAVLEATGG